MKNEIKIEPMTIEDYETIQNCFITEFDDFWTPEILKSELLGENKEYIVAKKEKEIIGFAGAIFHHPEAEIMNIVTKKQERKKGIGKMLLDKLIEISKEKNIENIFLEVNEHNIIAIKLYEKCGFMQVGIRKNYYNGIENAIIMSKKLNYL